MAVLGSAPLKLWAEGFTLSSEEVFLLSDGDTHVQTLEKERFMMSLPASTAQMKVCVEFYPQLIVEPFPGYGKSGQGQLNEKQVPWQTRLGSIAF